MIWSFYKNPVSVAQVACVTVGIVRRTTFVRLTSIDRKNVIQPIAHRVFAGGTMLLTAPLVTDARADETITTAFYFDDHEIYLGTALVQLRPHNLSLGSRLTKYVPPGRQGQGYDRFASPNAVSDPLSGLQYRPKSLDELTYHEELTARLRSLVVALLAECGVICG